MLSDNTQTNVFVYSNAKFNVSFENNESNEQLIEALDGTTGVYVTLANRVFYEDGSWNTLCLPFGLTNFTGTPLDGATVHTLSSSEFNNGTLTLNFGDELSGIESGKPYLVKWTAGTNVENPEFNGVAISARQANVTTPYVDFLGIYAPISIGADGDNTKLFVGANDKLHYPNGAMNFNAFRAYFSLNGLFVGNESGSGINNCVLNFGDGTNAVRDLSNLNSQISNSSDSLFMLDGRQIIGKPSVKGIYVCNGRKVVVK